MKKISLVVPMYNEEVLVQECYQRVSKILKGIENYSYEIIYINDGSTDKTIELLQNIAYEDKNVKLFVNIRKVN